MRQSFQQYAKELYRKDGKEALYGAYEETKQKGLHNMNVSSYDRLCRRIHREFQGVDPFLENSHENIATLEEAIEFHEIPESLQRNIKKVRFSSWESGEETKKAVRIEATAGESELTPEEAAAIFLKIATEGFTPPKVKAPKAKKQELLGLMILADPHIGRQVWGNRINGESYTLEDSRNDYLETVAALIDSRPVDRYLFAMLGDTLNSDITGPQGLGKATSKGTPQPETADPFQMFESALRILKDAISLLLDTGKPVDILHVSGNHDSASSYLLITALKQFFHSYKGVTFYADANTYQCYTWGKHAGLFLHGDGPKPDMLLNVFVHDYKEEYFKADWHSCYIGHQHYRKKTMPDLIEERGLRIHLHSSMAGHDTWHHHKGYRSIKMGSLHVIDKERGEIAEEMHKLTR